MHLFHEKTVPVNDTGRNVTCSCETMNILLVTKLLDIHSLSLQLLILKCRAEKLKCKSEYRVIIVVGPKK